MKNSLISCIIFICMLFSIFFSLKYLDKTYTEMIIINYDIEEHIVDENWDLAYKGSIELLEKWNKISPFVSSFNNDHDLHCVNDEIIKLTQYIRTKTKDESLATIHAVKYFINHINDMQKITMENIF